MTPARVLLPLAFLLLASPLAASEQPVERIAAPLLELTPLGPVLVLPMETEGGAQLIDGEGFASDLASALEREGFLLLLDPIEGRRYGANSNRDKLIAQGRAAGAGVVIAGTIEANGYQRVNSVPRQKLFTEQRRIYDQKGNSYYVNEEVWRTIYVREEQREVEIAVVVTAIDTITGEVLGSHRAGAESVDFWVEDSYSYDGLDSLYALAQNAYAVTLQQLVAALSPHRVVERWEWRPKRNKSELTVRGIEAAAEGRFAEAIEFFHQSYTEDPEERAYEWGNIAIAWAALGDTRQALGAIDEGLKLPASGHPLEEYRAALLATWTPPAEVRDVARLLNPPAATPQPDPEPAQVVRLVEGEVFINRGSLDGLRAGDRFDVFRAMEIADLDGSPLGTHCERVGRIVVMQVFEQYSVARVDVSEEMLTAGDEISPAEETPDEPWDK